MRNIQIGKLKKTTTELIMGTDYFTPEIIDKVTEVLENYIHIGGNIIDTAFVYTGGKSEQAIGSGWKKTNVVMMSCC